MRPRGADGSLTPRVGHAAPRSGPEANWLPASDGDFFLTLGTYLPKRATVDGSRTGARPQLADPGSAIQDARQSAGLNLVDKASLNSEAWG